MNYLTKYPRIAVFILGALSNLALAPFEFLPVLLVTFPLFLKIINSQIPNPKSSSFWLGWWFGFGYFLFGLYWISNSLLVDADKFAWLIPFAVSLIPAVLAVYIGLVAWGYSKYADKLGAGRQALLFSTFWIIAEIARNYLFTGFPWNLIGYASLGYMPLAQLAGYITVFGVGFVVVMLSLFPLYYKSKIAKGLFVLLAIIVFLINFSHTSEPNKNLNIRIVQPNIEQTLKWNSDLLEQNFQQTLALAGQGDKDQFDVIVLPEAAVPFHINRNPRALRLLAKAAPENGVLITGGLRSIGHPRTGDYKLWSSLYVINSKAEILAVYDKHHLVPFGEYVPLRGVLPIEKITAGSINFSSGENTPNIKLTNGLSFNPLICYEIIFPQYGFTDSDVIMNITNDGWFGDSTGPHQHLAMAKMRAIEQSKPVIRAANTGISAIIDSKGKVLKKLGLNKAGNLDLTIEYFNQNNPE